VESRAKSNFGENTIAYRPRLKAELERARRFPDRNQRQEETLILLKTHAGKGKANKSLDYASF
jgi:hypothetical protein